MKIKKEQPTNKVHTEVKRLGSIIVLLLVLGANKLFAFDPHWADIVDVDLSNVKYHRYFLDEMGLGVGTRMLQMDTSELGLLFRPLLQKGGAVLYDRDAENTVLSFQDTIQIKLADGRIINVSDLVSRYSPEVLDEWFPALREYQRRQNSGR